MKIKINKEKICIIIIVIIALCSRIYLWPNVIDDVNCDEAITALNAKAIAETGKDMYGTSLPVYFETWLWGGQSALLTYFMASCTSFFSYIYACFAKIKKDKMENGANISININGNCTTININVYYKFIFIARFKIGNNNNTTF